MPKERKIKNYQKLATTKLCKHALDIIEAGLQAVDTTQVVRSSVKLNGSVLTVQRKRYDLDKYERVFVIGIGKASHDAAAELERILKSRIKGGLVIDTKQGSLKRVEYVRGTHPLPSAKNVRATSKIVELLRDATEKDLILTIVSGGGSALLAQPCDLKCEHLIKVNDYLLKSGANIHEINTVRKHLSEVKGGQLAQLAYPATVAALIFSDVPGDDLSVIASGPTVLDKTTVKDAGGVLKKYRVFENCKVPHCEVVETPKEPKYFQKVQNYLLVSNKVAAEAMRLKAQRLGYRPRIQTTRLQGEAEKVGARLARAVRCNEALIAAGETTVTVKGKGKGGRNQELVLGAMSNLPKDAIICSVASDGIDNTLVAGALIDEHIIESINKRDLSPEKALQTNDSYPFLQKLSCQIKTGKTGSNVSDLMLVIRSC
jgi:glycerate 2-kinase